MRRRLARETAQGRRAQRTGLGLDQEEGGFAREPLRGVGQIHRSPARGGDQRVSGPAGEIQTVVALDGTLVQDSLEPSVAYARQGARGEVCAALAVPQVLAAYTKSS